MLEECHVRVTSLLITNNYVLIIEAIFILLPESIIMSLVWPVMYAYNMKVSSHWLQPPHIQCGGVRKNVRNHT